MDLTTEELKRILDEMFANVREHGVIIKHTSDRGSVNMIANPLLAQIKTYSSELRLRGAEEADESEEMLRDLFRD